MALKLDRQPSIIIEVDRSKPKGPKKIETESIYLVHQIEIPAAEICEMLTVRRSDSKEVQDTEREAVTLLLLPLLITEIAKRGAEKKKQRENLSQYSLTLFGNCYTQRRRGDSSSLSTHTQREREREVSKLEAFRLQLTFF